ncbi:hypothetical protein QBC34DRAFT_443775 [Podospora aff. communis PSN243]|uniref:Zn(2)-C6 fungal-type domain-containing protein n=1 Tax=Podospora aff. communis PSN243 TaxID=3040156 RepID=A0AAV9G2X4_9PEZI|nr:hypothetical protein QBC34DRAFT_443775 [Podospora aff. communis PSN243]
MSTPSPVLRCERCNKPFDKESTLKRHGYYCRSRVESPTQRSRSCTSCAKRKTRCDSGQPTCSTCKTRGFKCFYASKSGRVVGKRKNSVPKAPLARPGPGISPSGTSAATVHDIVVEDFDFGFDVNASPVDFTLNSLNFPASASDNNLLTTPFWNNITALEKPDLPLFPQLPFQPAFIPSTIEPRSALELGPQKQRTAHMVLNTLKSYPLMLLHEHDLPPFIHPRINSTRPQDGPEDTRKESLNNCISLLHMLHSGVAGSRKLFWRNVRMECERFCEMYSGFGRWETLYAAQALFIYVVLRLEDQHGRSAAVVDLALAAAVRATAQRLNSFSVPTGNDCTAWEDWIFEESRRRLCVVFRIVSLLAHFEPTSMCRLHETGLVIAPLPARKRLWDASDEAQWELEAMKDSRGSVPFDIGLTAGGHLVGLERPGIPCGPVPQEYHGSLESAPLFQRAVSWEEWCSGTDGLGSLVMLASALA